MFFEERRELHQHVGLVGVDDEQATGSPGCPVAGDQAVDVLARGRRGDELLAVAAGQPDQPRLDVCFALQPVRAARRAQRRAFDQEPVDSAQALVFEHVLEAEPGAPMGPQIARVEQTLAIGFDQQGAGIGRRVVDGDGGHRELAEVQRLTGGKRRRSRGSGDLGKNTRPTSSTAMVPSLP